MRIGVFLVAAGFPGVSPEQALRTALDYGIAAEDAGFDDVFMAEHHFMSYGTCPSALTFAALLAGRTARIGVGTAVTVLSTSHPVAVAEQAAILDVLTGGRFTLGVGRGGPWVDLEVFGTGMEGLSHRAFAEALEILGAWGTRDAVAYDGEFHRFREVPVVPRGRPPLLVACTSAETARTGGPASAADAARDARRRRREGGDGAGLRRVGARGRAAAHFSSGRAGRRFAGRRYQACCDRRCRPGCDPGWRATCGSTAATAPIARSGGVHGASDVDPPDRARGILRRADSGVEAR